MVSSVQSATVTHFGGFGVNLGLRLGWMDGNFIHAVHLKHIPEPHVSYRLIQKTSITALVLGRADAMCQ